MVSLLIVVTYFFGIFIWGLVFSKVYSKSQIMFCILAWLADKSNNKISPELLNYYNNGGEIPKEPLLGYCGNKGLWKMPRLVSTDKKYLKLVREYRRTRVSLGILILVAAFFLYLFGLLEDLDAFGKALDYMSLLALTLLTK